MRNKTIDRRWLPLNALRAFQGVAKHGAFTTAANALLISQSTLSRHVMALEQFAGVQLFARRPHALTLTDAGRHLLSAVMRSFEGLELALDDIRNEGRQADRTLRVQMPLSFAMQLGVPILRDFRRAHAQLNIELVSADSAPHSPEDVAVVYSRPTVTDLITDLLWPARLSVACHPSLAAHNTAKELASFIAANEIVHVQSAALPRHHVWSQFVRQAGLPPIHGARSVVFDTAALAVQYVLSGRGIALIDTVLFSDEVRAGRLAVPFDVTLDEGYGYHLITHPAALSDTTIALFRSWLIDRFATTAVSSARSMRLVAANDRKAVDGFSGKRTRRDRAELLRHARA